MKLSFAHIIRKIYSFSVRVNSSDINAVDLNYHFGGSFKRKAIFFTDQMLGQLKISFNERRAVGRKIHIAFVKRSRLFIVKLKFHFGNLPRFAHGKACDFDFFAVNISFQPPEAQRYPFLGAHTSSLNFNVCHSNHLKHPENKAFCVFLQL